MSDRDRVLVYLTGLVAIFVLALLVGRVAAPSFTEPEPGHGGTEPHAATLGATR